MLDNWERQVIGYPEQGALAAFRRAYAYAGTDARIRRGLGYGYIVQGADGRVATVAGTPLDTDAYKRDAERFYRHAAARRRREDARLLDAAGRPDPDAGTMRRMRRRAGALPGMRGSAPSLNELLRKLYIS